MSNWIREFYDQVDASNVDAFADYCAENVVFRLGAFPTIRGLDDVMEAERQFLTTITSHSHRFVNIFTDNDTSVLEAVVTYIRLDGRSVDVPCTTILHRTAEKIDSIRVYLDITAVYAPVDESEAVPSGSA